jgi:hypothetical protein
MLNTKKAKLSRRKPPSIFKKPCTDLRGFFCVHMTVSQGSDDSVGTKKHLAISGEVRVALAKYAGLFVVAHEHQQELKHVQEIKVEV